MVETVVIFLWDQPAKEFYYPSASVHTGDFDTELMKPALLLFPLPIVEDQQSTVLIHQPEALRGSNPESLFSVCTTRESGLV